MKEKIKSSFLQWSETAFNLVVLSIITGIFSGVVITFYNILMKTGEDSAKYIYAAVRQNPQYILLLLAFVAVGAVLIGTLVRFVPMIRGSGIPQIEGAARGVVPFNWYVTMCAMFAASLACVFLGYPAGAEGPSLEIGGCAGGATGVIFRRNRMVRRLQIASGASSGLAVAFNAPVTGMIFALEEAFRSFSPQVFICSAISVITALITRNSIRYPLLGEQSVGFSFNNFVFEFSFDKEGVIFCLFVVIAAILTALIGVGFYKLVFIAKRYFGRITFLKNTGKYIIPFVIAGIFALITDYSIGGGHEFIDALATQGGLREMPIERVFGTGLIVTLVIIVSIRFITSVLSMGCGVPCGVFIPMLAMGAGIGAVLSVVFQKLGMSPKFGDYLIIICMAAFFTCVVKAPVTGIVMVFELSGQFANFLPALLGITAGYLVGFLFKTEPIYEKCLSGFIAEEKLNEKLIKESFTTVIGKNAKADGRAIRSVIWPANGLVVAVIDKNGNRSVPNGRTVLHAGETIIFECETMDRKEIEEYLDTIVGQQDGE